MIEPRDLDRGFLQEVSRRAESTGCPLCAEGHTHCVSLIIRRGEYRSAVYQDTWRRIAEIVLGYCAVECRAMGREPLGQGGTAAEQIMTIIAPVALGSLSRRPV